MKMALRKEWYCTTAYVYNLVIILVAGPLLSLLMGMGAARAAMFMMLYLMMLPLTSFGLDETSKWDRMAVALPVGRDTLVAGRYLYFLLAAAAAVAVAFVQGGIVAAITGEEGWVGILFTTCAAYCAAFFCSSAIAFPLVYRLGADKARLVLMLITLVVFLGMTLVMEPLLSAQSIGGVLALLLAAALVLYGVSFFVSRAVYRRREY